MLQAPATIEPALDLILVSRHLERIGDHATNVAEDVIFMVSARDVRHHARRPVRAVADRLRPLHYNKTVWSAAPGPVRQVRRSMRSEPPCAYCRKQSGRAGLASVLQRALQAGGPRALAVR